MERSQIINVFPPSLNTAVFVDRKNYRLQDIQLSKILRGASPLETPRLAHSRGPLDPRSVREGALAIRSCASSLRRVVRAALAQTLES